MGRDELRALTGLRGVAALWVMIFHFENSGSGGGALMRLVFHRAYLAVDLFFCLSGFVIALNYAKHFDRGVARRDMLLFVARRLARIYPLYAVTLLAGLAQAAAGLTPAVPLLQAASNLLLIQQWGIAPSIDPPAWSISAEFLAYLVFPWLALQIIGHRPARVVCIAALAFAVAATALAVSHGEIAVRSAYPLLRCVGGFTLGVCAYSLSLRIDKTILARSATPVAIGLGVTALVAHADAGFVAACPLAVMSLSSGQGVAARILGGRLLHRAGELSYSIYLIHWLTFPFVRMVPGHHLIVALLTSGLVIAMASCSYRLIELPCRRRLTALLPRAARPIDHVPLSMPTG